MALIANRKDTLQAIASTDVSGTHVEEAGQTLMFKPEG